MNRAIRSTRRSQRSAIRVARRVPPRSGDGGIRAPPSWFRCGSILVVPNERRESLNLRVIPEVKRQVVEYADHMGISINAAAILLITEGARAQRDR